MRFLLVAATAALLIATPASAQQPYTPPRAADGHVDIGRVWSNADAPVTFTQMIDGAPQSVPFEGSTDALLPLRDPDATLAWRRKYGVYMSGKPQPDFTLGPDSLPNRDRCLMAANAAAPPMTSQGYNDAYQIIQTPAFVVIAVEMMDETRIIPVVASAADAAHAHRSPALKRWTGDSVGWWEGDTFVVETTSVSPRQTAESPMPMSPDGKVLEYFTRTGPRELSYRAEMTDPALYLRPWSISYTFHPTPRAWEYACHEGNYGMPGILSGVRETERKAK